MQEQQNTKHRTNLCLLLAILAVCLFNTYETNAFHAQASEGRNRILQMEARNEKMLLDHMTRTVQRWEQLQHDNKELNIKQLPEPVP